MKLRLITSLAVGAVVVGASVALVAFAGDTPTASPGEETAAAPSTQGTAASASATPIRAMGNGLAGSAQRGVASHTQEALNLDPASVTQVGSFALPSGGRHEVYVAKSRDGWTCIIEERPVGIAPNGKPLGLYGGGCSPGSLQEYGLKISISGAGDVDAPGTEGVSIVGIAGPKVERVVLRLSNGKMVAVPLNAANAFQYTVSASDIGSNSSPATVVAFDAGGKKVNEKAVR